MPEQEQIQTPQATPSAASWEPAPSLPHPLALLSQKCRVGAAIWGSTSPTGTPLSLLSCATEQTGPGKNPPL